jgi:superfamily II DNA or RNA helicase
MSLGKPCLRFDQGTLTLQGVSERAVLRIFSPSLGWRWDPRAEVWRTDALHYPRVCQELRRLAHPCEDQVPRWVGIAWPIQNLHPLRQEQSDAVAAWSASGCRGTIVMPTGTGKSEVALTIMAQTQSSTLVVAPVRDLMYQWHRRIVEKLGIDAGIVGDNVHRPSAVCVTTYDSACIHMPRLGDRYALLVFDECHHLPGAVRRDAARMSAAPYRLGLTATPLRADGRHVDLPDLVGPIVYEQSVADARGRSLADFEVVRIPVQLTGAEAERYAELSRIIRQFMQQQRQTHPHFDWEDLCAQTNADPAARKALQAFHARKAIEDRAEEKLRVLEDLFRLHFGEPLIVFVGSNAMARDVSLRFLIPCLLSHCGKRERREILRGLEQGTYPALVANRVLDEGVDLPEVKVAVVIGGLGSSRQAKQRLGRVLRRAGNQRAVLYEIVAAETGDVERSRQRRRSDAYQGTRHRRI